MCLDEDFLQAANTKSQLFASCHHGPGPRFLMLSLPHNLLSPCSFCSVQYSTLFFKLGTLTLPGMLLTTICDPESLLCSDVQKAETAGPSWCCSWEQGSLLERHIWAEYRSEMAAFQISMSFTCWGLYHFIITLGRGVLPTSAPKRQNEKEATSSHVLLVFSPLVRPWASGSAQQ